MKNRKILLLFFAVLLLSTGCRRGADENGSNAQNTVTPVPFTESPEPTTGVTDDTADNTTIPSDPILEEVRAAVIEEMGEDYIANMPYDSVAVAEIFGVQPDWYDAGIAEGPMMSTNVDKFLAFHATNGNLEKIKNALQAYRESIIANTMQYPMNLNKVQGCLVETVGDYAFLVMVGFIDDTAYDTEDEMIAAHVAINQKVIKIAQDIIK